MTTKIKTHFHYIIPHATNAGDSFKPWNWKSSMKTGDTLYLWMPAYGGYSKNTIDRFVYNTDFDGTPGGLFFIDGVSGLACTVSLLNDHIIKRSNGSWIYAKTGKDASDYVTRYNPEARAI